MVDSNQTFAVAYLARGADMGWFSSCERFLASYRCNPAGLDHSLYIIFKGFAGSADLEKAQALFSGVPYQPVFLGDDNFDIGAYIQWAKRIKEDVICVFNTASEILAGDWLRKLAVNLALPGVGLVGATASYESLRGFNRSFPAFPNVHIRSTAFMTDRRLFLSIAEGHTIVTKADAWHFESGPHSLTQGVLAKGLEVLLVGRNGRGYSPQWWAASNTFRQASQDNLLVADNQTRLFASLPWTEKKDVVGHTWGKYIKHGQWLQAK